MKKKVCRACKEKVISDRQLQQKLLKTYFPFLVNDFRELAEKELEKAEVFKELFPDKENIDFGYLKAIFQYQKISKSK
jgi:hypothetical protein